MSLGGEIAKKVRLLPGFLSQTMPQQACGRLARGGGGRTVGIERLLRVLADLACGGRRMAGVPCQRRKSLRCLYRSWRELACLF